MVQDMLNGLWQLGYRMSEDFSRSVSLFWRGFYTHQATQTGTKINQIDNKSKPFLTGFKGKEDVGFGQSLCFVVRLVREVRGWFRRCWMVGWILAVEDLRQYLTLLGQNFAAQLLTDRGDGRGALQPKSCIQLAWFVMVCPRGSWGPRIVQQMVKGARPNKRKCVEITS